MFRSFVFKNGAIPQDKFFVVLKKQEGNILLASLPTSKDHVPSDVNLKRGCTDIPERMFNAFVFLCGEHIAMKDDGTPFAFNKHTFIYGTDLDMYPAEQFDLQKKMKQTVIEKIGVLKEAHFNELVACLSGSKMVKNKFRKMLQA
ncbi:MAG: hypothetical protein LUC91_06665 [Prevotella sp.]|nr:hypothetical protein [Prevotella sp.]